MSLGRPEFGRFLITAIAVLAAMSCGAAALARDSLPLPDAPSPVASTVTAAESSIPDLAVADPADAPPQISFSRAASGEGRVMYASRGASVGGAAVVGFSATRPRVSFARTGALSSSVTSGPIGQLPRFLPVSARVMTSGFGPRYHPILGAVRSHMGVDLAAPAGTPIAATLDGIVSFAAWDGGYGLLVAIDHGGGIQTRYAHMSRIAVAPGQRVHTGEVLGYVGTTGLSTGPHVHYEVRVNGQAVSPLSR